MHVFSRVLFLHPFPVAISLCLVKREGVICMRTRNKYPCQAKDSQWNFLVLILLLVMEGITVFRSQLYRAIFCLAYTWSADGKPTVKYQLELIQRPAFQNSILIYWLNNISLLLCGCRNFHWPSCLWFVLFMQESLRRTCRRGRARRTRRKAVVKVYWRCRSYIVKQGDSRRAS